MHLTDKDKRWPLVDCWNVTMSDLHRVLTSLWPLEDGEAGGRGRGGQPRELHHAAQRGEEVQVGDLALVQTLVLQLHRGYLQWGCHLPRNSGHLIRLICYAQLQPVLENSFYLPTIKSFIIWRLEVLAPEAVTEDAQPGPVLVPLDAVVVPAQPRVHHAAQRHPPALPETEKMIDCQEEK